MTPLHFERGDADAPVGHAFVYFSAGTEGEVAATYIIVPPVPLDFAKYVPPLLASTLGASGLIAQTLFLPIPPVPETLALPEMRRLAELRGDDILADRSSPGGDMASLMARVADVGEAYARAYQASLNRAPRTPSPPAVADTLSGLALLYSVLSERERLEEIARRLGTLRYAVEGGDAALAETTRAEVRAIAEYLPARFRAEALIEAAARPDTSGTRLAQLYLQRGYLLCSDDAEGIRAVDEEIASIERDRP